MTMEAVPEADKVVGGKNASPRSPERRRKHARARITNDNGLLPDTIDGRSVTARRFRDITTAVLVDQGGANRCSESRLQLIRRFAAVSCLAEQMEGELINGTDIDINRHALLCSTAVRLAQRIGLSRHAKAIVDSLFDSDGKPVQRYSPLRQSLAREHAARERAKEEATEAEVIDD